MKLESNLILIVDDNGYRLCQDDKWRNFAPFGTVSYAVKTYKRLTAAKKKAASQRVPCRVVSVPSDETVTRYVEASGKVIEHYPVPDQPGFVYANQASLNDFEVFKKSGT